MNEQQEREAFEAWAKNRAHPLHDREPLLNGAIDRYSDIAWAAWQARAALAANEKQPSRATDITTALALPGCERLREWAEIGPVQRAAVEEFAYAMAAKVPADWRMVPVEPTEEMLQEAHMQVESHSFDNEFLYEVWDAMLAATPAPAPEASIARLVLRDDGRADLEWRSSAPAPEATPAQAQQAGEPLTNIESPFNACQHREHCKGWKMVATDVVAKAKPEAQQPLSDADLDALMGPGQEFVAELPSGSIVSVHAAFGRSQVREAMRAAIGAVRGIGASGEASK